MPAHEGHVRRAQPDARAARGAARIDPSFEQFMERFGDFFPEQPRRPSTSCSSSMAQQMAAMQAMLNSMTPEQRAQLAGPGRAAARGHGPALADVDQLGQNLQQAFPASWAGSGSYDFSGQDPLGFAEAAGLMSELGDIDQLEQPAAQRPVQPRRPRRGRPRPGPRAARRRRRPRASSSWPSWPASSRRPASSRTRRAGFELTPRGIRQHRPERARRPVQAS